MGNGSLLHPDIIPAGKVVAVPFAIPSGPRISLSEFPLGLSFRPVDPLFPSCPPSLLPSRAAHRLQQPHRSSEPSCPQLLPCDPPGCSPPRISGFLEEQGWSWGEGGGQGSGGTRGMRPQPITPGSGSAPSPARHRLLTPGQPPGGGGLPQNPRQHLESTLGCPPRLNPMWRWVHHRSLQLG